MTMNSFTMRQVEDDSELVLPGEEPRMKDVVSSSLKDRSSRVSSRAALSKSTRSSIRKKEVTTTGVTSIIRDSNYQPVDLNKLVKDFADPAGRRKSPRHDVKMTVVVYGANRSFRTNTINVSAGGVMIEKILPDGFGAEKLDILFIYNDKNSSQKLYFMMRGECAGAPLRSNRLKFLGANTQTVHNFENFIKDLGA